MPAKSRSNGLPAYQRIQGSLRKRIEAGDLRTGDAVPSERDLAKIHSVSLMTARHALASLEREGVVERRRGIGTFVPAPKIHFNKLMSYTEQMASRSMMAVSKVLFAKIIDDEQEANARLSLSPKSGVIKLERLRHAAGEPFALETCYLSAAQFPGLLSAPLQRESLFGILERDLQSGNRIFGRRSGRHGGRSAYSGTVGCAEARTGAANPAGDFFHERKSHSVRFGILPVRSAQSSDTAIPGITELSRDAGA